MRPRINVLTIGVDDLQRSLRFYKEGLEIDTDGIVGEEFEHGAVVFYNMKGGLILALYPRKEIAWDAQINPDPHSSTEFTIGHNVNSKKEVDETMMLAEMAGAMVVKLAQDTFWGGYASYFKDPDGHLWEIAWNPEIRVEV